MAAILGGLAGCAGNSFDWSTVRQIKPGMSETEVVQLLGPPALVKSAGGTVTWSWSYANLMTGNVRAVSVQFKDGVVIATPDVPKAYD